MRTRLVLSIIATTVGLAFWWALTEPLPIPPPILLAVPAVILFCSGLIAGRLGVVASPVGLLFSLLVGSIIATQLHQYFAPATPSFPELLWPLAVAALLGLGGGFFGERLAPSLR